MRLMIVGSDKVYAIENYYRNHLMEQGVEISLFTAQSYFYDYYQKSVIHKLLYRASLSGIIPKINKMFRERVEEFNPDIIWIFKGMEIVPESLVWAQDRNIKLVNYNPDNPFIFSGRGSGNPNVTNSISLYDLHFTYNLDVKEKLEHEYQAKTAYLPFGYELSDSVYELCTDQPEILKLCFLGNPDTDRAAFIEAMAQAGIPVDVYGNDWKQFVKNSAITISGPVYGEEFWKILRRYRIQLNLMRPHNEHSHNMRSFEVPAVGGIMLAPDTPDHRNHFENGKEVFLFSGIDDAIGKAKAILNMPAADADEIRTNARNRSVEFGYSYRKRSHLALQEMRKIVF